VQMATSLGLKSIAEIVETRAAAQDLQRMGCNFAQGYFFCEPLEAEEALQVLRNPGKAKPRASVPEPIEDDAPTLIVEKSKVLAEQTLMLPLDTVQQHLSEDGAPG
jgi:predicted signal transduction protein with EAL and GGDEF domain